MDEKLVNDVLEFLPTESSGHFVSALKFYEECGNENCIKSAESLRRALEEFLRFKLNNTMGLQQNIKETGKELKKRGGDAQIRNIIAQIFGYLDQYFNENSKHNDGEIDEPENEFLIYQIGLLMRYLNRIL